MTNMQTEQKLYGRTMRFSGSKTVLGKTVNDYVERHKPKWRDVKS